MPTRNLAQLEKWADSHLWAGVTKTERKMLVNYKQALDAIRLELGKVYEKYASGGVLTHAEMTKYDRLTKLHQQLTGIMGPALSKNGKLVERLSEVQYEESFFVHAWALDQATGVALRWGLVSEKAVQAALEAQGYREMMGIAIKNLKREALASLDRTIVQGLIRGYPYEKMARAIKKDVLERSAVSARRIAQTEAHRAQTLGQMDNYEKAEDLGIKLKRVWVATLDERTRESHGALDGAEADEDGMFHTSVGPVAGPGLSGDPGFDINCRCRIVAEVEDTEPAVRRVRDEGVVPYTTYGDWAKEHGIQ